MMCVKTVCWHWWAKRFTVYVHSCWGKVLPCHEAFHATSRMDLQHHHTNTHTHTSQCFTGRWTDISQLHLDALAPRSLKENLGDKCAGVHRLPLTHSTEHRTTTLQTLWNTPTFQTLWKTSTFPRLFAALPPMSWLLTSPMYHCHGYQYIKSISAYFTKMLIRSKIHKHDVNTKQFPWQAFSTDTSLTSGQYLDISVTDVKFPDISIIGFSRWITHVWKNKQVVKVIWHKAASPPHMDGSVAFARWRQCNPI